MTRQRDPAKLHSMKAWYAGNDSYILKLSRKELDNLNSIISKKEKTKKIYKKIKALLEALGE